MQKQDNQNKPKAGPQYKERQMKPRSENAETRLPNQTEHWALRWETNGDA